MIDFKRRSLFTQLLLAGGQLADLVEETLQLAIEHRLFPPQGTLLVLVLGDAARELDFFGVGLVDGVAEGVDVFLHLAGLAVATADFFGQPCDTVIDIGDLKRQRLQF